MGSAKCLFLSSTPLACGGFPAWASVCQSGVVTAVVTSRCFRRLAKLLFRFSLSFALWFFGPSLGSPFLSCSPQTLLWPLLTALGLSAVGSPRVRDCSFRSRLWALQGVVDDCWAWRVLACSPPTSCLTAHLCSFGRTFVFHPFASPPCGDDLAVRLRLASSPPSGTFHPDRPAPCLAHERRRPRRLLTRVCRMPARTPALHLVGSAPPTAVTTTSNRSPQWTPSLSTSAAQGTNRNSHEPIHRLPARTTSASPAPDAACRVGARHFATNYCR